MTHYSILEKRFPFRCTQEHTSSSNGSFIVFEHSERAEVKENQVALESISVKPSTSKVDVGQSVCPKNVRKPHHFVPCVFLGKPRSTLNKCPAANWDSSTLSEDDLSQNRLELNNNSYIDMDTPGWSEKQENQVYVSLSTQLILAVFYVVYQFLVPVFRFSST